MEAEQPGATVSSVDRNHGIVTGLRFRWPVEFGVAQKKRARLASIAPADDTAAAGPLRPPEGMVAVDLPDGRRFFALAAIPTSCERALRAERFAPHHELDSSVRTQLNRVAVDGDRCGRAPRVAS